MSALRSVVLAAVSTVVLASAASAAPIVLNDVVSSGSVKTGTYKYQPGPWGEHEPGFEAYQQTIVNGPSWAVGKTYQFGDIIGDPAKFDADSLTIDRGVSSITFTLKTRFSGSGTGGTKRSDWFINTTTPTVADSFNYAIVLGNGAGTTTTADDYTRGPMTVGFYQVGTVRTSNDVWASTNGYYIGGLIGFCQDLPDSLDPGADGGICDAVQPGTEGWALEPAVQLATGVKIGDVAVNVTSSGGWYYVQAVVTTANMSVFDQFDILATSADCSNDALWGTVTTTSVPAPGALLLIGLGLLGMGLLRRRAAA
jgi:hypothetical protein